MWSSDKIIGALAQRIPHACIQQPALANVRELAAVLPNIFSGYYLECRLAAGDDQVDLVACLDARNRDIDMKEIGAAGERMRASAALHPGWQHVGEAISRWAESDGRWSSNMPFLWLEFDHAGACAAAQAPSIAVCTDATYLDESRSAAPREPTESCERCLDFVGPTLPAGLARLLSPRNRELMQACFSRLPEGGRMLQVTFMTAREPMTIKLYGAVPRASLRSYLDHIGWPGSRDALEKLMATFHVPETADDTVYLDLSLNEGLSPYAGVAYSQLQLSQPSSSDPRRAALLGLLEKHRMCAPEKQEALRDWPGNARERSPGASGSTRIHRFLDIKLTLGPPRGTAAKAYLGFVPYLSAF